VAYDIIVISVWCGCKEWSTCVVRYSCDLVSVCGRECLVIYAVGGQGLGEVGVVHVEGIK
jgi:hypothetical protein